MRRAARIYAVAVNRVAYPIWVGLLAIRVVIVIAALCLLAADWAISHASAAPMGNAAPQDLRAQRQRSLEVNLSIALPQAIVRGRASCAMGKEPENTIRLRSVGITNTPDAADVCVTVLTRLGRDGTLGYVRDPRSDIVRPALAFDRGFVTAWRNRESTSGLPTMAALKPIAERCLAQAEKDTDLCHSAGYAYGTRAANGELVVVQ